MIVLMVHPNGTARRWVPERKIPQFERGGWRRKDQPEPERARKPRKADVASSEAENQEGSSS